MRDILLDREKKYTFENLRLLTLTPLHLEEGPSPPFYSPHKQCKDGCYFGMWAACCFDLSISSLMDKELRSDTSPLSALLSNEQPLFVQKGHEREWERGQKSEGVIRPEYRERKEENLMPYWCNVYLWAKEKDIDKDSTAECLKLSHSGSSRRGIIGYWMKL